VRASAAAKLTIRNVQCRFKTEAKLNVHWLRPHGHLQETYPHSNSLGLSKRRLQRYPKIFNKIHFANFALWFWDGHLKRFCPPLGALGEGRRADSIMRCMIESPRPIPPRGRDEKLFNFSDQFRQQFLFNEGKTPDAARTGRRLSGSPLDLSSGKWPISLFACRQA
jgi:hypothetical protein